MPSPHRPISHRILPGTVTGAVNIRKRKPSPCPCGCGNPDGLCEAHRARLAGIRDELFTGGLFSQRSDQRRVKRGPTCGSVGCWNPRPKGARYCADCEQAFEQEGEAA